MEPLPNGTGPPNPAGIGPPIKPAPPTEKNTSDSAFPEPLTTEEKASKVGEDILIETESSLSRSASESSLSRSESTHSFKSMNSSSSLEEEFSPSDFEKTVRELEELAKSMKANKAVKSASTDSINSQGSATSEASVNSQASNASSVSPELYSMGVAIRLSQNPPLPTSGVNNPYQAPTFHHVNQFIRLHTEQQEREAMADVMGKIQHISIDTFKDTLAKTVAKFNVAVGDKPYLLLAEEFKSNKWVAELANPYLANPQKRAASLSDLESYLPKNPHPGAEKTLVLMDDAAYSGEQMCGNIKKQMDVMAKAGIRDFDIHIVIPYATRFALHRFNEIENSDILKQIGGRLHIHTEVIMETIAEKVKDPQIVETLNSMYFPTVPYVDVLAGILTMQDRVIKDFVLQDVPEFSQFCYNPLILEIFNNKIFEPNDIAAFLKRKKTEAPDEYQHLMDAARQSQSKVQQILQDAVKLAEIKEALDDVYDDDADDIFEEFQQGRDMLYSDRGLESRTLTIFDHKVADGISLLASFQKGEVWHAGAMVTVSNPVNPKKQIPLARLIFQGQPPYKLYYK